MKLVFLGYAVSMEAVNSLSGASIAGNKMQVNALKAFSSMKNVDMRVFTVYPVAAFPKGKLCYGKKRIDICSGISSKRICFVNLPIVKQIWQTVSLYLQAVREVDKDTVVLTFNCFPQVGIPAKWLKERKHCKFYSLLADLPIDDNYRSKSILRNWFRKIFDAETKKAIHSCDGLIVLNENAAKKFAPDLPYVVVEGGVDLSDIGKPYKGPRGKNIVYSGALSYYSGVMQLIQAMELLHNDALTLEIYGSGPLKTEIVSIAQRSRNVRYMGSVTNREMLDIQRKAYLLVNPRPVDDPISQVTFPSKMFEYMTSGTPVLSTRINGLTDGFLEHLFIAEDHSPEKLAEMIDRIAGLSEDALREKANGAYDFIVEKKNWNVQAGRILDFMKCNTKAVQSDEYEVKH